MMTADDDFVGVFSVKTRDNSCIQFFSYFLNLMFFVFSNEHFSGPIFPSCPLKLCEFIYTQAMKYEHALHSLHFHQKSDRHSK